MSTIAQQAAAMTQKANDETRQMAEKILSTLEGQRFTDWYNNGEFDAFITGDLTHDLECTPTQARERILEQIIRLFRLEK